MKTLSEGYPRNVIALRNRGVGGEFSHQPPCFLLVLFVVDQLKLLRNFQLMLLDRSYPDREGGDILKDLWSSGFVERMSVTSTCWRLDCHRCFSELSDDLAIRNCRELLKHTIGRRLAIVD